MNIYLDMLFALNFLVDFLLLLGTNRLCGFPAGAGRCAGAALLGGMYAVCCLLPGFRFLGNLLWRLVALGLIGVMAFGYTVSALKRTGVFVILSMALGGTAVSIGRGDFLALVLAAGMMWLLCRISFGESVGGREYLPVTLTYGGSSLSLVALRDTGNTLRDPITGQQVLIISAEAAGKLTGLTERELSAPLETLARHPIPGLRLIPYQAVGQGSGMLLALRFDNVRIGAKRQSAIVAFAPEGLGKGSMYQALAGGTL